MSVPCNHVQDFRFGRIISNIHDVYIGRSLRLYGEYSPYETLLFDQILLPGMWVIEAGANIGSHTVHMAQLVGDQGRVYAFEPQRLPFQLLNGNLAINSITNTYTFQQCLGDAVGTYVCPELDPNVKNNWGGAKMASKGKGTKVSCTTIDALKPKKCHFIKIDVEGMELDVLRGATETIMNHQPLLYFEYEPGADEKKIRRFLNLINYKGFKHTVPLYHPDNAFGCNKNIFFKNIVDDKGEPLEQLYCSFNLLAIPQHSAIKIMDFEEF